MLTFLFGLLCLLVRQLFSWGGNLSEEARDKVRATAAALDCVGSDGEPDFRAIAAEGYKALHNHGQVRSKKEIMLKGRSADWVYDAVIDDMIKSNGGLDDGTDEAEEAIKHLKSKVLWGGLSPQAPSGVGQSSAVRDDLVLCETTETIDGRPVTLRFLSRTKDVVKDYYCRRVIDTFENTFKRTHNKLAKVALAVVPELEADITKMLRVSIDTGLAQLPEAKYEGRPKKIVSPPPTSAITAAADDEDDVAEATA